MIRSVQLDANGDAVVSSTTTHDVMVTIAGYGSVLETTVTNSLGHSTKNRTDGAGRVIETVDAENFVTKFEYDANGNRLKVRDPNGVGQDCQYDALNRDILCADTQELLDGTNRRKEYDLAGNVLKQIDAKGNTTFSYFDSRNRRFETKDRNNATTSFTHDAAGNELSMTDAENQTTSYLYDQLNRRTKITWPDHVSGQQPGDANCGFETTAYDAAGRAVLKTNQLGDTIAHVYDAVGRMLSRDYRTLANSPSGAIADTDTFTYDSAGRMLTATKGRYNNTVTFTYENGRKLTEALTILGQTYTVTSGYDAAGRETSLLYPDGSVVNRTFTNRGQLASVNLAEPAVAGAGGPGAAQPVSTFTYDNGGRETSRTYGNGVTTTRAYQADNMVTSINAVGVESIDYTYDANKNPTSETRSGVMAPYSWSTGQSGFDPQNRLTNWTRTNGDAQSWNLPPVNDWQSFTNNTQTQTRTHGPTHELQAITNAGSTTPTQLQHDPRGNLTQDDRGCLLTYDPDNMLSAFSANNVSGLKDATYQYDALGRRVSKSVVTPASGNNPATTETTIYALAGQQVIAEYSPSGSGPSTLNSRQAYGSYIDEPLVLLSTLNNQPSTLYYHPNRQYSPYTLTDATGNPTERYTYTPYGKHSTFNASGTETPNSQPTTPNRTLFTGRTFDQESALHYFRGRYYEASLGQFTSHDPIEYPDGDNTYAAWFAPDTNDPHGLSAVDSYRFTYISHYEPEPTGSRRRPTTWGTCILRIKRPTAPDRCGDAFNFEVACRSVNATGGPEYTFGTALAVDVAADSGSGWRYVHQNIAPTTLPAGRNALDYWWTFNLASKCATGCPDKVSCSEKIEIYWKPVTFAAGSSAPAADEVYLRLRITASYDSDSTTVTSSSTSGFAKRQAHNVNGRPPSYPKIQPNIAMMGSRTPVLCLE